MVTRGMSSAMPISSLKCHMDQALCPEAAVGAGVQEHQAGPPGCPGTWVGVGDGLSLSVRGTKAIPEGRSAGDPLTVVSNLPFSLEGLAQLSQSTTDHPTPSLSLHSDCHRPRTAHRGPLRALAPWGTVCCTLPSHMGLCSHQLGTPTRGSRETHGGTRTLSLPFPRS